MKVLHIISSSGMYGAEAVILNLARAFVSGSHSCALGVFDNTANPNRQLYEAAQSEGVEAYLIPCAGQVDRSTIGVIRRLAAATRADLVHAHGYKADVYCFLALRGRIPLVSTCHTWYDTDRIVTLYGKLDRIVLRGFNRVVGVSEEVRQRLLAVGVKAGRIHIVRNGIDLGPFAAARPSLREGLAPGVLLIGLVGRLSWEKGVDNYLAAAAKVFAEFPNARFVVAGEGPDRALLEATIDELGLRSVAILLGRRDDMPSVYASLDLLVSASRQEGLPIALLEAMASGVPIVATTVGEVPTVIRDGCTGALVPPGEPAALATAVLSLLRDPARRARFSEAGRELVATEYSSDRMARDYLRVYDEALSTGSRSIGRGSSTVSRRPRIFMMDLWATIPYYTAYLSRALLQQGANLRVGSISYYLDPDCFSSRGLRLQPGLVNFVGRFSLPRRLRRILKLLESLLNLAALSIRFLFHPPDTMHVQFLPLLTSRFPLDLWFLRYCQSRGIRIVLTVHDLLPHDTGLAHKATFLALYGRVDALICHSASIRDRLAADFGVPAAKVSIIPHGPFFYDLPPTAGTRALSSFDLPPGQLIVLWQGIIFPYKGVDVLLDAWRQVEARTTGACLVIVGTGQPDLLDKIRGQIAGLKLERVHLHFRFVTGDELVALYRAAAIVAYPYRAITTSGALATGLALGKAIVATDLPVFRELLMNRENALLVPPPSPRVDSRDAGARDCECVASLAGALCELIEDSSLRDRLAACNRASNFGEESWNSIAQQTLATYNRVLSQRP